MSIHNGPINEHRNAEMAIISQSLKTTIFSTFVTTLFLPLPTPPTHSSTCTTVHVEEWVRRPSGAVLKRKGHVHYLQSRHHRHRYVERRPPWLNNSEAKSRQKRQDHHRRKRMANGPRQWYFFFLIAPSQFIAVKCKWKYLRIYS